MMEVEGLLDSSSSSSSSAVTPDLPTNHKRKPSSSSSSTEVSSVSSTPTSSSALSASQTKRTRSNSKSKKKKKKKKKGSTMKPIDQSMTEAEAGETPQGAEQQPSTSASDPGEPPHFTFNSASSPSPSSDSSVPSSSVSFTATKLENGEASVEEQAANVPALTLRRQPATKVGPTGDPLNPSRLAELEMEMSKEYFLNCILGDDSARSVYRRFLEALHCAENLAFWLEVEEYKRQEDPEELARRAQHIYEEFIKPMSPNEVNLSHKMREEVEHKMKDIHKDIFTNAQKAIFLLMVQSTFDYFLRSDLYKMYKENRDCGIITARKNSLTKKDEETFELAAAAVAANRSSCCILS